MDGMYFDGTNLVSLLNPPGVALFRELGCCGAKFSYRIDSLKLTASLALETRPKPQKERLVFPLPPFFQGRTVSFTDFLGGQMNCFVMFFFLKVSGSTIQSFHTSKVGWGEVWISFTVPFQSCKVQGGHRADRYHRTPVKPIPCIFCLKLGGYILKRHLYGLARNGPPFGKRCGIRHLRQRYIKWTLKISALCQFG